MSSVSRFCIIVFGYLQCVTVVIPDLNAKSVSFIIEFYLLLTVG